jgi:predicted Zn-dependent protease
MVEKALAGPRVRIVTAGAKDSFAELAKNSTLKDNAEPTLRLINGMYPDGEPMAGELIKIIE